MTSARLDQATSEWARQSRLNQGLPEHVEDLDAIETVAAIFRSARRAQGEVA